MNPRPLILLIFANSEQAYLEGIPRERQQLMELLRSTAEPLGLKVDGLDYSTVEGVIKALNVERKRLVVLHFAGHSTTELLQLDEGVAHAQGLAAKLAECPNLKLVFLNGCNNVSLVKAIAKAGIPNVIGTRQPVSDSAAHRFSQGFFNALAAQGRTIDEAFQQARLDVETLTGQHYRSLDIHSKAVESDWIWFIESTQPNWRLADIALPCNRLPALPHGELPAKPFKNLYYYTEADAEIFFGRCQAILDIIQLLDDAKEPILLLHGGTGVGKSSFLLAGLIPRLKAPSRQQTVHYHRYNEIAQPQDLLTCLFGSTDPAVIRSKLDAPSPSILPSIWIIDQLEEIFFDEQRKEAQAGPANLHTLLATLHTIFYPSDNSSRPQSKVILSLRKEWFAELHDACRQYGLNQRDYLLKPLDKASIMEIIEAPAQTSWLQQRYGLKIINPPNSRLAEQMADDLLTDKQSNIAPTLQITLFRLWEKVEYREERMWTQELYLNEKRKGLLLEDYLEQQLANIAKFDASLKESKESGLLLDILFTHTTPQGTSKTILTTEYDKLYSHIESRHEILNSLKNHHLIIEPQDHDSKPSNKHTRISHDTLANLVRLKFEGSDLPGQRARRIIDARKTLWRKKEGKYCGPSLDMHDLKTFKKGSHGTKNWKNNLLEESILNSSIKQNRIQKIKNYVAYSIISIISIFGLYLILSIDRITNHDNIDKIENQYIILNTKRLENIHNIDPSEFDKLIDNLIKTKDESIMPEYRIRKYTILSELFLIGGIFYRIKNKNEISSEYTSKAIDNSILAENLMVKYGLNTDFIKGGHNEKNPKRYLNLLFTITHEYSILYCNGNLEALKEAQIYIKKISRYDLGFIDRYKSKHDICLDEVL